MGISSGHVSAPRWPGPDQVELLPAIDLRNRQAVRLYKGDFSREKGYGDPVALAEQYAAAGARQLHVVDLDAARSGIGSNRDLVIEISRSVPVPVQTGGGVRSFEVAEELISAGVARIVLGTAAIAAPGLVGELCGRFPGRIVVGLDHRPGGEVAIAGWEQAGGKTVSTLVEELQVYDIAAFVVTSIERDGTFSGPDLESLESVLAITERDVIASGGVSGPEDLRALAKLRSGSRKLAGAIVGKAFADGRMSVEEAIDACEG